MWQHGFKLKKNFFEPSRVHCRNRFPHVSSCVESFRRCQTHRPVVAADAVEEVVDGRDAARRPAARHRRHRHPAAHPGVEPFDRTLIVGGIEPTQGVNAVV